MRSIEKPKKGEYPPYVERYMKWMPDDGQLLFHLKNNFEKIKKLILALPEEKLLHRYAQHKWTIKEVLVHLNDDERVYAYRALCFARNDKTELPGFEEKEYAHYSKANERDLKNILEEYEAVRNATISLFNGMPKESLVRFGTANENRATVRALGYHIAGHEMHHLNIIKERYLK